MFTESAELYDAIYFTLKDYPAEAERMATILRALHPGCRSVLDVACGTGEHARLLTLQHGFHVDGLDLNPEFVRLAQAKIPAATFVVADMSTFRLDARYDAILCLFSSIGYLKTLPAIEQALRAFAEHMKPDAVMLVEPWFGPGQLQAGPQSTHTTEAGGLRVARHASTEIVGRLSRLTFQYEIEGPTGARSVTEIHELGLFTIDEMLAAFKGAELDAEYEPEGPSGRGLYVARLAAAIA